MARQELLTCRRFDYDRRLLPNDHLRTLEPDDVRDFWDAQDRSGATPGFPAWNLLYFVLFCSLPIAEYRQTPGLSRLREPSVVETGTNHGASTIVMAQALRDAGLESKVQTVERNEDHVAIARANVEAAGLSDQVEFHTGNALDFLGDLETIDFVFLDDNHRFNHVMAEMETIRPKLREGGTVFFDNTLRGGVARALEAIPEQFGGNVVHFRNASVGPPGNAIWQL